MGSQSGLGMCCAGDVLHIAVAHSTCAVLCWDFILSVQHMCYVLAHVLRRAIFRMYFLSKSLHLRGLNNTFFRYLWKWLCTGTIFTWSFGLLLCIMASLNFNMVFQIFRKRYPNFNLVTKKFLSQPSDIGLPDQAFLLRSWQAEAGGPKVEGRDGLPWGRSRKAEAGRPNPEGWCRKTEEGSPNWSQIKKKQLQFGFHIFRKR